MSKIEESGVLIVLGNGHNLAMGLRTSYSAFASHYLIDNNSNENSQLKKYLTSSYAKHPNNWSDMEGEIKYFALHNSPSSLNIEIEHKYFIELIQDMGFYMDGEAKYQFLCNHIDNNPDFIESLPVFLFKTIFNQDRHYKVISLNYTDLDLPMDCLARDIVFPFNEQSKLSDIEITRRIHEYTRARFDVRYVHLSGTKCILGIDDDTRIHKCMNFLKKAYQFEKTPYNNVNLKDYCAALFYGYSFGETDSDFVRALFDEVLQKSIFENPKLYFVTRDDVGKEAILNNLTFHLNSPLSTIQKHIRYDFIIDDGKDNSSSRSALLLALMRT